MSAHQVPAENFISTLRKDKPVFKDMDTAHAEDYADKRRIDDQIRALEVFIADAPARCHKDTIYMLRDALRLLKNDSASVVRAWD